MKLLQNLTTTERIAIVVAILIILMGTVFLSDGQYNPFSGSTQARQNKSDSIGEIKATRDDVRHKSEQVFSWDKARRNDSIQMGDSVFAGKDSGAVVKLKDGQQVDVGENSLVHFVNTGGQDLANLKGGNFRLRVDGKMKVAINGKITTVEGKGSELQVVVSADHKPRLKLLKGEASITTMKAPPIETPEPVKDGDSAANQPAPKVSEPQAEEVFVLELKKDEEASINLSEVPAIEESKEEMAAIRELPTPQPTAVPAPVQQAGGTPSSIGNSPMPMPPQIIEEAVVPLVPALAPTPAVTVIATPAPKAIVAVAATAAPTPVSPPQLVPEAKQVLQVAATPMPASIPASIPLPKATPIAALPLKSIPLAASYPYVWHLSDVYEKGEQGIRRRADREGKLPKTQQPIVLKWKDNLGTPESKYLVQLARNPSFKGEVSEFRTTKASLEFNQAWREANYWRVKRTSTGEGSAEWSQPTKFSVLTEYVLSQPQLERRSTEVKMIDGEGAALMKWSHHAEDTSYIIEVSNNREFPEELTQGYQTTKPEYQMRFDRAGEQFIRVTRVNKKEEISKASPYCQISVLNPIDESVAMPLAGTPGALETPGLLARDPASVDSTISIEVPSVIKQSNDRYSKSSIAFEGASNVTLSSEQYARGETIPIYASAGVRGKHWSGDWGGEGAVKAGVFGVNSTGQQHKPIDLEARVHRRWNAPVHWLSFLREFQVSIYGGGEVFRNQKTSYYSPGYNLVKLGLALDFPVALRWSAGGEIGGGYGLDTSRKTEIGGFVRYYLESRFALGAGYRMHLFEAGSTASAPAGVPYREAYGEGYSLFQYNY